MTDGLLSQQLAARKAYRDADQDVLRAITEREQARRDVEEAKENYGHACRRASEAVVSRAAALKECERLGIMTP